MCLSENPQPVYYLGNPVIANCFIYFLINIKNHQIILSQILELRFVQFMMDKN